MDGKWLIFWWSLSLKRSWASMWESVHITSQTCDFFDLSTSQPNYWATFSTTSYCVSVIMMKNTGNVNSDRLCVDFFDLVFDESRDDGDRLFEAFFGLIIIIKIVVIVFRFWAGLRWRVWIWVQFFHVILLLI